MLSVCPIIAIRHPGQTQKLCYGFTVVLTHTMVTSGYSPRLRTFLLVFARLAVFVYVFQISAIDHLHNDPSSVVGIKDTTLHAAHCHSAQASCADATSLTSSLAEITLVPTAPAALFTSLNYESLQPNEASILTPTEPPRAA